MHEDEKILKIHYVTKYLYLTIIEQNIIRIKTKSLQQFKKTKFVYLAIFEKNGPCFIASLGHDSKKSPNILSFRNIFWCNIHWTDGFLVVFEKFTIKKPNLQISRGEGLIEWGNNDRSRFYMDNSYREKTQNNLYLENISNSRMYLAKKDQLCYKIPTTPYTS